jgi:hypothetical protein
LPVAVMFVNESGRNEQCWFLKNLLLWNRLAKLNRNLVGSILGRSSIKIVHLIPIHLQTWPPHAILISDWLISKKSSPLKQLSQMNWNLVESICGKSSINVAHFVNNLPTTHYSSIAFQNIWGISSLQDKYKSLLN